MGLYIKSNNLDLINKKFEEDSDAEIVEEENKEEEFPIIYKKINERWSVGMCLNPSLGFRQISFVNGINTTRGGKHVDYIVKQITSYLVGYIEKEEKSYNKRKYD